MKYSSALCSSLPSINLLCTFAMHLYCTTNSQKGEKKHTQPSPAEKQTENRSLLGSNNLHFLTAALCDERKGKRSKWRRGQSPSKAGALLGAARGGGSGCAPFSAWKCVPAKGTVLLYNVLCCGGATAPSLCEKRYSIYSQGISSAS